MALGDLVGISTNQGVRAYDNGDGTFTLQVQTTAGVPTTTVVTKYLCSNTFTVPAPGATVGDTINQIATYNTATGALISTVWTNVSEGTVLAGAPNPADLQQEAANDPFSTAVFSYVANTSSSGATAGDVVVRIVNTDLVDASVINIWYNVTTGTLLTGGNIPNVGTLTAATPVNVAQLPATLGQKTSANSLSVVPSSDATYPLPTGAATSALQTTGNTTLTNINNKLPPALGIQSTGQSLSVVVANGAAGDVAASALFVANLGGAGFSVGDTIQSIAVYSPGTPNVLVSTTWNNLTTGSALPSAPLATSLTPLAGSSSDATAANQTTQINLATTGNTTLANISGQLPVSLGQKASAGSVSTVLASDATLPLPTGAATLGAQTTGNASLATIATKATSIANQLPPSLGLQAPGSSMSVVVANQVSGDVAAQSFYQVVTPFTDAAVNDILQAVQIYIPDTPSTVNDVVWNNLTTGVTLTAAPNPADINPLVGGATDVINTTLYAVNVAGGDYSKYDSLQKVEVLNPVTGDILNTIWYNLTTGLELGAPPVLASITPQTSQLPTALGPQAMENSLSVYVQNPSGSSSSATNVYTANTSWVDNATQTINTNDVIQQILVFNTLGVLSDTIWFDVTQAYTLVDPPPAGSIDLVVGSTATAGNQLTQISQATTTNSTLSTISAQLPTTLGQKVKASSVSVTVASDNTVATSSLQLPPALGAQTVGNSMAVNIANADFNDVATSALFQVTTAFSGANVGDILQSVSTYTPGTPNVLVSTTWNNLTQGTVLGSAPSAGDMAPLGTIVTPTLPQTTPDLISTTSSGTVAAGAIQVSFANTGTGPAIIGSTGVSIPSGATLDFQAASGGTLAAIDYDATGTVLLIATVV